MTPAEEKDFTQFVHTHADRLLRFARLLVPDDGEAEDITQAALIRLTRHWSRRLESPEAYARTTIVNLVRDRSRRRHLVPVPSPADPDRGPTCPDHAEAVAARAQLDQILTGLPERQRVTVVLRVLEGLTEQETATALGCSLGTVKSNLARGLDKVRAALHTSHSAVEEATR